MNLIKFIVDWWKLNDLIGWFATLPDLTQIEIYERYSHDFVNDEILAKQFQKD